MLISSIQLQNLTHDQITYLLFGDESDDGRKGDCIFTFGGSRIERVEKAVELYNQGRSSHILFAGGTKFGRPNPPEAIQMLENAIKIGVPKSAILVETESNHTKENVISSLLVLDRNIGLHKIRRLLVVSVPWHYRRCMLTLKTYMPKWIEYTWCPANHKEHQPDNWWKSPETFDYVMGELNSLTTYVQEGQLIDEDISWK